METIAINLLIGVGCLIPVVWAILIHLDVKSGRPPAKIEAYELFCVLLAYGAAVWVAAVTVASIIHSMVT